MERVLLASQLEVELPSSLDLTFQPFDGELDGDSVICAWQGEELQYIVSADDQPGGMEHTVYWEGLHETILASPDVSMVKLLKSGEYSTKAGANVTYRIYRMVREREEEFQIYHLLNNHQVAYWIIGTLPGLADIFVVNAGVTSIVRTARLIPTESSER